MKQRKLKRSRRRDKLVVMADELKVIIKSENDSSGAKQAENDIKQVGDATDDAGKKAKQASFNFKEFATNAGLGASAILAAGGGVALAALKSAGEFEQQQIAFTTLLGDSKKAQDAIAKIEVDAKATPFNLPNLIKANQLLISAGINSDKARTDIKNLGNAISATGGGTAELNRLALNLQQIQAVGNATALDIKQFAFAGIPIFDLLADSMKQPVEVIKEMDIGYEDIVRALQVAGEEGGRYAGAMENQSQSLIGSMSNIQDAIGIGLKNIAVNSGLFAVAKDMAQLFLRVIEGGVPKIIEFFTWVGQNNTALSALAGILGGLLVAAGIAFIATFGPIILATLAFAAAGAALGVVLNWLWPVIQTVTTFLSEHHAIFAGLVGFITTLAIPSLISLIGTVVSLATTMITVSIPAAIATVLAFWPIILVAALVGGAIALLATAWSNNWGNIRQVTETVVNWIIGKINSVIQILNFMIDTYNRIAEKLGSKSFINEIKALGSVDINTNVNSSGGDNGSGSGGGAGGGSFTPTSSFSGLSGAGSGLQSLNIPQGGNKTVIQNNTINNSVDMDAALRDIGFELR